MWTDGFAVFIFLVIVIHAEEFGVVESDPVYKSGLNISQEYKILKKTCLRPQDYKEMAGDVNFSGAMKSHRFLKHCIDTIGLNELRGTLGIPPLGPWTSYNFTDPSPAEFAAASTTEEYYKLKEPIEIERSLNSYFIKERHVISCLPYMEKRFPIVRRMFRERLEKILENTSRVERETVDELIASFKDQSIDYRFLLIVERYPCPGYSESAHRIAQWFISNWH